MKNNKLNRFATRNFWRRIKGVLIQDVPEEIATCEFDCRHQNCLMKDWEHCPNKKKPMEAVKKMDQ